MKFIAHRGLRSSTIKENTIPAFLNAINSSVFQGFEFDIRQTKDKVFLVNHNAFINKDLISHKNSRYLIRKYHLVTLDSVLRLDTKKVMLVEIKTSNPDYSKLSKILNSYPNKNIYVMSFHNHVIKNLKKYQKNYKLGILNYIINSEEKYEYDFICLLNDLVDNKIINYYLNHKIEVFMYGVINEKNNLYYDNTYYILDHEPVKK